MIIVTGGAGFIGSVVIKKLNLLGISNIIVVDNLASSEKWKNLVGCQYLSYLSRDEFLKAILADNIQDTMKFARNSKFSFERISTIIHLGACSSTTETNADFLIENNLKYSQIIAEFALRNSIRFVHASSASTYGDGSLGFDDDPERLEELRPLNMYAYSKHLFDLWANRTGRIKHMAIVKLFNVYGPNEYHKGDMRSMIYKAYKQIKATGKIQLFRSDHPDYEDGEQKRDFIYVKDCAKILIQLAQCPQISGIFNLGSGQARSWNGLATSTFRAMGKEVKIEYIDMPESLKGKYQYFTEAPIKRLKSAFEVTCPKLHSIEAGITDYVQKHLLNDHPYI